MMIQIVTQPVAVSVKEAAAMLSIGTTKMNELISNGVVSSYTEGTRRLIPYEALQQYVRTRMTEASNG